MGSRRWVTCLGCGAPLPRPKRRAAVELRCPWCEAANPLPPSSSPAIPGLAAFVAIAAASTILAAIVHGDRSPRRNPIEPPEPTPPTGSMTRVESTRPENEPILADWSTAPSSFSPPPPELVLNLSPSPPPPWSRDDRPAPPPLSIDRTDRAATVPTIQPLRVGELPRPRRAGRPRNVLVGDALGRRVVARYEGDSSHGPIVTMPDGQLGRAEVLFPTDAPFVPITTDRLRQELLDGPFAGFHSRSTAHYVVLSSGTEDYAEATARLLESLYQGLADLLRHQGLPIHQAEFPLVAVIDATEDAFRARKPVPAEVRAYYDPLTNRIALYETSERAPRAPELSSMNQPRIVAHEGTHQVLQNIGVQPRLASWPAWLSEGLAEYCAPTATNPDGTWKGCGTINPLHMATLRDLDDPLARTAPRRGLAGFPAAPRGRTSLESLLTRAELAPIDYAIAWSLTYYLAQKRPREFQQYLARMVRSQPLDSPTAQDRLDEFRQVFGPNLNRLDQKVQLHLASRRGYPELPYYCVYFEQWQPDGTLAQDAIASQSPAIIEQWLRDHENPDAPAPSHREVLPLPTKLAAALLLHAWGFEADD